MSSTPQFTLYSHASGPNGWRVVYVLKALNLSYKTIYLDFTRGEHKAANYLEKAPNGRIPTLVDHAESDFTVWESGAILLYLAERYDLDHDISAEGFEARSRQQQWLFFQASGQGPYFGQAAWFKLFHPEPVPSAVTRYENEVVRVLSVLDGVLSKPGFQWLNGDKVTIADITWISWNSFAFAALLPDGYDVQERLPALWDWHQRLIALPYVVAGLQEKEELGGA